MNTGVSILAGECGYAAVRFIHRDRSVRTVSCSDGLVFQKLEPADTAGEMGFLDANGLPLHSRFRVPQPR